MISRDEAIRVVRNYISKENNLKHMIAVGAIMRELAVNLGEDALKWEVTGILHDIDFETCNAPSNHTLKAKELLQGIVDDEIINSILAHNYEYTSVMPDSKLKKALIASDAASGLIVACALVMPSKKLDEVKLETLLKKYKSKDFARNVSRERIAICNELALALEQFLQIALEGMKKVSGELGL
ncbi:MAG: HD domain-containing protein [Methanomassiliicoccales archaeon]|jgi:predicted hydrolase (HD superfamily)|nr:HD domain-containing protein [Methanomassiliicoccales archaeon]